MQTISEQYTAEKLLQILRQTPRACACDFGEDVRRRVLDNPLNKAYLDGLCRAGDRLRGETLPVIPFSLFRRYETDGDRTDYEFSECGYFKRRNKLMTFGLLAWLYGRDEDIRALEDIMWGVMDEYTWALPAHLGGTGLKVLQSDGYTVDLFAAETGETLSEIVAMVGDRLHPIVVARVRQTVKERILDRATASFWWQKATNNWAAVCAGSVGIAAMYSDEPEERVAEILAMCLHAVECFLSGFSEDGACLEGISYWNYGFGYFMAFADTLARRTAGKIDLFASETVHKVAAFYQKCFFMGGRTVSFSDGSSRGSFAIGTMAYLRSRYPDIILPKKEYIRFEYPTTGCFRFALGLRELLWAAGDPERDGVEPGGTYVLPAAEWYISQSQNGVGIAAKAGNNDEPHNHNDVGSFQIYKNGQSILTDLGSGEYSKDYFGAKRYTIFCNGSQSHSVPIINGEYQRAGKEYAARNTEVREDGLRSDISGAYPDKTLSSLVRDIRFCGVSGKVTLTDTYSFTETPREVTERFVYSAEPVLADGTVTVTVGGESMTLTYDPAVLAASCTLVTDKEHRAQDRHSWVVDLTVRQPKEHFTLTFSLDA